MLGDDCICLFIGHRQTLGLRVIFRLRILSVLFVPKIRLEQTVCYAFGTVWFIIAYKATLKAALATCVVPFLLPECGKILLAALLTNRLIRFVK